MRKDLYIDLVEKEETHFWHKAKRQLVSDLIVRYHRKEKSSTTILDVGIGSGGNTKALQQFGEVWGIDASPQAVAMARKRGLAYSHHTILFSRFLTSEPEIFTLKEAENRHYDSTDQAFVFRKKKHAASFYPRVFSAHRGP